MKGMARRTRRLAVPALVTLALAGCTQPAQPPRTAAAAPAAKGPEASIPFASFGTIRNYRVESNRVVFLEGLNRRWYRAELLAPCFDLPFTEAIGIETRPDNQFDRFSTLLVRGQRCPLTSLTAVEGEPPKTAR